MRDWVSALLVALGMLGTGCALVDKSQFGAEVSKCDIRRDGAAWCDARERARRGGWQL